jgi:hypothetical protein
LPLASWAAAVFIRVIPILQYCNIAILQYCFCHVVFPPHGTSMALSGRRAEEDTAGCGGGGGFAGGSSGGGGRITTCT